MKKIVYYADDASMGDTSPAGCDAFRRWAESALEERYPAFSVLVSKEPRPFTVVLAGVSDAEAREITDYAGRLWDLCPAEVFENAH